MVENLLNGVGINAKYCLYQHCYMLAKYYLQQGLSAIEVREKIFAWAAANNIYIAGSDINLNQLIFHADADDRKLRGDVTVRISEADIQEIVNRFDKTKVRKVALAVLCYAKVTADEHNQFVMSVAGLSNWLGYNYNFMLERYLPELAKLGYIDRVIRNAPKKSSRFQTNPRVRPSTYQIFVPHNNAGKFRLHNNDINTLYQDCFESKQWEVSFDTQKKESD